MNQKKQIDYSTLEWFDCQKNFPPMRIDLYVDSEHGFGIGRLGKRVKDGSTIWTVHLDSGEVYLVYAFYKVKRWAYMPKDEKTNTKLKHELMLNKDRSWVPCYNKSEADKAIAEKDAEIRRLKRVLYKACANWADCEAGRLFWEENMKKAEKFDKMVDKCRAMAEKYK